MTSRADDPSQFDTLAAPSGIGGEPASRGPSSITDDETRPVFGDRYEVLSLLGSGGMGTVYMARDRELDEVVALKVLRSEVVAQPGALELFRREVKLARKVTHPNVARTFDIGESGGSKYLTMELVEGTSLARILDRCGRLPIARVVDVGRQIAAGLAAAHAVGVIHRDLKPENVLVRKDDHVLITDFGVARPVDAGSHTITMGVAVGTPAYMAPEQVEAKRDIDGRADIYALGVLLFEILAGELPFSGDSALAVAAARLVHPPPDVRTRRPDVPDTLAEIVKKSMARDRSERFATIDQLLAALATMTTPIPLPTATSMRPTSAPTTKAVAVLPFKSVGASGDAFTSEGIWDDLIDSLSMTEGLRVRPASSVARHAESREDPRAIGQALGVDVVVEGSVRSAGETIRVSARLLNVADGFQLWAKKFDRSRGDIFALSDEMADAIARALTLSRDVPARVANVDDVAMDAYLRGRAEYRKVFSGGLDRAIGLYEQALLRAPDDPTILAGYAVAQVRRWFFGHTNAGAEARRAAERALALAPHLVEARHALALLKLHSGEPEGAIDDVRAVLQKAAYGPAHESRGGILQEIGLLEEARWQTEEALRIDPDSLFGHLQLARGYALGGQWDEADIAVARSSMSETLHRDAKAAFMRFAMWQRKVDYREMAESKGPIGPVEREIVELLATEGAIDRAAATAAFVKYGATGSSRRQALMHQIETEVAGFRGDGPWALEAARRAVAAGLFDIVWLERCPILVALREEPGYAEVEREVRARADQLRERYQTRPKRE